jgi:hypothetical protein
LHQQLHSWHDEPKLLDYCDWGLLPSYYYYYWDYVEMISLFNLCDEYK